MKPVFQPQKVKVRMYRPGLGDCFLLTFIGVGGETRYMMIDCGVLQNTEGAEDRLLKIVKDIQTQTGGTDSLPGKLHILVATHEHADHLAGFNFHTDIFKQGFSIDEVWMAWTENKLDPKVAALYSAARKTPLDALVAALSEWEKAKNSSDTPQYIKKILDFISEGQMDTLKTLGNGQRYLAPIMAVDGPSNVVERDDFGRVRFHVLGPPENTTDLVRGDIPKDKNQMRSGEPLNQVTAFTNALLKKSMLDQPDAKDASQLDIDEIYQLCLPFDPTRGVPVAQARQDAFFIEHYGFEQNPKHGPDWRRIDNDWLESAGELALDLDSNTNNTSLVLAIELTPGGKVLLFPGDAQHGSWLSWVKTQKGMDLLSRTVFYKIAHHGSNNATLINGGLDQMSRPDLVAMIPVDPVRQPAWKMPNPAVKSRLLTQAKGRVIVACEGVGEDQPCWCIDYSLPLKKPDGMPDADWQQFLGAIDWDKSPDRLWVEYTLTV